MTQQLSIFLEEQKAKLLSEKIRLEKYDLENVKGNYETKEDCNNKTNSKGTKLINSKSVGECFDINLLNSKLRNSNSSNRDGGINNLSDNFLELNFDINLENKLKDTFISPRGTFSSHIEKETNSGLSEKEMPSNDYLSLSSLGTQYEQKKRELLKARQQEYKEFVEQQRIIDEKSKDYRHKRIAERYPFLDDRPELKMPSSAAVAYDIDSISKGVQTEPYNYQMPGTSTINIFDSPNITNSDVLAEPTNNRPTLHGELPRSLGVQTLSEAGPGGDKVAVYVENINIENQNNVVDNRGTTETPRVKLMNQLKSTYYPSFGESYETPEMRNLRRSQEQAYKREIYQAELRQQITEKRKMIEAQKALEEEEDRALARRFDAQLKAIRLEKEQEMQLQQKRLEKIRKNTETICERKNAYDKLAESNKKTYKFGNRRSLQMDDTFDEPLLEIPQRPISPPIPTFRNKGKPPFSMNIEDDSIFAKSMNNNLGKLSDQMRDLEKSEVVEQDPFPPYETNSFEQFGNDYKQIVDDWKTDFVRDFDEVSVDSGLSEPVHDIYLEKPIKNKGNSTRPRSRSEVQMDRASEKIKLSRNPSRLTHVASKASVSDNGQRAQASSILTQLGAIRKQLQLEQMRLDETITRQPSNNRINKK